MSLVAPHLTTTKNISLIVHHALAVKAWLQRPPTVEEAPLMMLIPMWTLIGASIYFGINATFTGHIALTAARSLLGGAP